MLPKSRDAGNLDVDFGMPTNTPHHLFGLCLLEAGFKLTHYRPLQLLDSEGNPV
jgi:hypothetical protein